MIINPDADSAERNAWIHAFRLALMAAERAQAKALSALERARTQEDRVRACEQLRSALRLGADLAPLARLRTESPGLGGEQVDLGALARWLRSRSSTQPHEVSYTQWPESYDQKDLLVSVTAPAWTGHGQLVVLHWRQHLNGQLYRYCCGPSAYLTPAPWRVELTLAWWAEHGPALREVCAGHLERHLQEAYECTRQRLPALWQHPEYEPYLELLCRVQELALGVR